MDEKLCCLLPTVFDIVCGYIEKDFAKWITSAAKDKNLKTLKLFLLQRTCKSKNLQSWGLFDAALLNPHQNVIIFLIDHFIKKGYKMTKEDPFIVAMKRGNMHAAHHLEFPNLHDWPRLLRMILKKAVAKRRHVVGYTPKRDDSELKYCVERHVDFRAFFFLDRNICQHWSSYIIAKQSMFALEACIASPFVVDDKFIRDILMSPEVTPAIFSKLWQHCFGNLFDQNSSIHTHVLNYTISVKNIPILNFLVDLPFFQIGPDVHITIRENCLNIHVLKWLLINDPLQLDFLLTNQFLSQRSSAAKTQLVFRILDNMPNAQTCNLYLQHTDAFSCLAKHQQWTLLFAIMDRYHLTCFGSQRECAIILTHARVYAPHIWYRAYKYTAPGTLSKCNFLFILWMSVCNTICAIFAHFFP